MLQQFPDSPSFRRCSTNKRLCSDPAEAALAEKLSEGGEQMNRQEEQIAHESNVIMPANLRKTAPQGLFGPEITNSPPIRRDAPPGIPAFGRTLRLGH